MWLKIRITELIIFFPQIYSKHKKMITCVLNPYVYCNTEENSIVLTQTFPPDGSTLKHMYTNMYNMFHSPSDLCYVVILYFRVVKYYLYINSKVLTI